VHQVPRDEISAYGVIDGDCCEDRNDRVWRIRDLVEKPQREEAPSDLAIIGRYILTPDIFEALAQTPRDAAGEIQLTNRLRALEEPAAFVASPDAEAESLPPSDFDLPPSPSDFAPPDVAPSPFPLPSPLRA